jgi:hypothetical protein
MFVVVGIVFVIGVAGVLESAADHHPKPVPTVPLARAVTNTLGASGYTEVLSESTNQGNQTGHLVYQAPDRLGGYLDSAGHRMFLVIIGSTEYLSVATPSTVTSPPSQYFSQATSGVTTVDPAHTYLPYFDKGPARRRGAVTTVTLTQDGKTETLVYTVAGDHVTAFRATTPQGTIRLAISDIGSSPSVTLPAGATTTPAGSGT